MTPHLTVLLCVSHWAPPHTGWGCRGRPEAKPTHLMMVRALWGKDGYVGANTCRGVH